MNTTTQQFKQKQEDSVNVKDFKKTVGMLIELLGRDMESTNPSRDRDFLIAVREGLFKVEIAGQLFEHIKAFRTLLVKHFQECARIEFNKERHIELAKSISKLSVQAFAGKSQIFELLKEFGVDMNNTEMAIFAITQFIEMIRRLPIKFFYDPDNRFQIISTMQNELDALIALEEQEAEELVEGVND